MKQKKILFLGGAHSQLPAIKYAKNQGYFVITVDYLPENPGHKISDDYYNISTTDKEAVLNLATQLKIDAISAYASDPAAPTAAFVSEKLNLIGSSFESVTILSNKNLFRNFLKENEFNVPWFICSSQLNFLLDKFNGERAIIKPVDSSGSKGIFMVENRDDINKYFEISRGYSRTGEVILEKYIERKGPQIHGEGFILNGEVIFIELGDQFFSPVNNLAPYSTIVPSIYHKEIIEMLVEEVRLLIKKIGFNTGGINIEIIRDLEDNIYILEIGARNGGNFMPQLIYYSSKFDLVKANVDSLLKPSISTKSNFDTAYYAQIILHSNEKGIFSEINIPFELENCLIEKNIYYTKGQMINKYNSSKDVVGVLILELDYSKIENYYKNIKNNHWIELI